ncbi:DedA family protein, partial [Deinococcus sp.]|uniref:DedA family protein n=1 Tax=Deinococcus sp. TaxID=47478 RepID=UPI0025CE69F1
MLDPEYLLKTFSYLGLFLIIFAETGLLIGFFLPGDTLLITAGLFAARGDLNIWLVALIVMVAAFLGNASGYYIGRTFGPMVFARVPFLKAEYVEQAREFFASRGNSTLILGRFIPIIRTLVPTLAGTIHMNERTFMVANAAGAVLWGLGIPVAGLVLGKLLPRDVLDKYILVVVGVIFVVSF